MTDNLYILKNIFQMLTPYHYVGIVINGDCYSVNDFKRLISEDPLFN